MVLKRKIFIINLLLLICVAAIFASCKLHKDEGVFKSYNFPKPIGWVSDFEHLYSKQEKDTLDSIIDCNEKATSNEIAVVTTNDPIITMDCFKDYVTAMHNNWGVGKKEKNNGVLVCILPRLHLVRINNGYGIEEKMSDDEAGKIIKDIIAPEFKKGNYYLGTKKALMAIIAEIK